MKTKIFLIAMLITTGFNTFAQTMLIQQGQAPTISFKAGSTATSAIWTLDGSSAGANGATLTRTWSEAVGTHNLDVTPLSTNSCSGTVQNYTIKIFTTLPPLTPAISAISDGLGCSGGPVTVTATPSNYTIVGGETVKYKVGTNPLRTTTLTASGTFAVDPTVEGLAAGSTTAIQIEGYTLGANPPVVIAGPTANIKLDATPTVIGIQ